MTNTPKRRQPNAAIVSKVLREAGFAKATKPSAWGSRDVEGFIVTSIAYETVSPVKVLDSTASWQTKSEGRLREMAEALREAGFNVSLDESPHSRWCGGVWVSRWEV